MKNSIFQSISIQKLFFDLYVTHVFKNMETLVWLAPLNSRFSQIPSQITGQIRVMTDKLTLWNDENLIDNLQTNITTAEGALA